MAASREDISKWFDEGVAKGATHMCIICDTFDHEDFPRYVMAGSDPKHVSGAIGSMERLMEVYALHLPKDTQLNERRSFHYEAAWAGSI
jgi:hypothetical protein